MSKFLIHLKVVCKWHQNVMVMSIIQSSCLKTELEVGDDYKASSLTASVLRLKIPLDKDY